MPKQKEKRVPTKKLMKDNLMKKNIDHELKEHENSIISFVPNPTNKVK